MSIFAQKHKVICAHPIRINLYFNFFSNAGVVSLECYVGKSENYPKNEQEDYPRPPKLMDCKEWLSIKMKKSKEAIKKLKNLNSNSTIIQNTINLMEQGTDAMCKDKCRFCGKMAVTGLDVT